MKGRRSDIDLTGKKINELFVRGEGPRIKNKPTWECECSCGKICYKLTNEIISGNVKSCGHLRGRNSSLDLTGRQFNDLTALYYAFTKGKKRYWHCKCSCGEECDVVTSELTCGIRKDCGHTHNAYLHEKRTKSIVGEIHGYLKVLEMLPSKKVGKKWRAMCKAECLLCGNIIDVQKDYLISGDTNSCGCLKSVGEQEILSYLLLHNIPHKQQFHFDDLLTEKNGFCWFDFGILNEDNSVKFLIEYQGRQHYEEQPGSWNFGKYAREVTDPLKRKYCKQHNIPLYEIKYDSDIKKELDKIFAC